MAWVVTGEFRKLWIGQLVSASGSAITTVALSLVAVVTLQASPAQMGALSALSIAPHLAFGLLAGVWVDRWSRRRVLIWTDVGRLVLLGSVPATAALGRRQELPQSSLGDSQVTASWRTLVIGGQTVGAAASGVLATAIGIRPTLLVATAGMLIGLLIAVLSPLRTFHSLPTEELAGRSMA